MSSTAAVSAERMAWAASGEALRASRSGRAGTGMLSEGKAFLELDAALGTALGAGLGAGFEAGLGAGLGAALLRAEPEVGAGAEPSLGREMPDRAPPTLPTAPPTRPDTPPTMHETESPAVRALFPATICPNFMTFLHVPSVTLVPWMPLLPTNPTVVAPILTVKCPTVVAVLQEHCPAVTAVLHKKCATVMAVLHMNPREIWAMCSAKEALVTPMFPAASITERITSICVPIT
mmetsp:Transcript_67344/g.166333  ORF Transcript_67344/g.166333 Transcript_67344/m.166333 type:complete len:234 (-) Transcript_67344:497-1198(-)